MANTILLDQTTWDLCLDAAGHIALAAEPYALAQAAACQIKLFEGEYWYDTTLGVPYLSSIMGITPIPLTFIKQALAEAALDVPNVASAEVFVSGIVNRVLTGQVQVKSGSGQTAAVDFSV